MGIERNLAEFLISAPQFGVSFKETCTLGHQDLLIPPPKLARILRKYDRLPADFDVRYPWSRPRHIAEPLLKILGAERVVSLDFSEYQGAALRHDLNTPIPESLKGGFDVVLDGGTLEHVFHFTTGLRNAMEMVRVNGHFLALTQCNNACGHGFYQLSPELYFRAFSADNGFALERIYAFLWNRSQWYEVVDPAAIGRRVMLINGHITGLLIQARRIHDVKIFASIPQQSDYVDRWREESVEGRGSESVQDEHFLKASLRSKLGARQLDWIRYFLNRLRMIRADFHLHRDSSLGNRRIYKRVDMKRYPKSGVVTPHT